MYASAYQQPEPIEIRDFAFAPNVIIIPVGTTVRWTNDGAVNHTVTSDTALFDSGTLAPAPASSIASTCPAHTPITARCIRV